MENWEETKKKKRLEFIKYCGGNGIGSVLMMDELFLAFDWFYSELELAKQEERERIESVKNYLYDIEIPPGDAKIDVNFDVKYYAMKMEDKLKAEFVASKLKYWLKLQVLYLEKGLKKQIASIHQNNNEQGGK